MTDANHSDANSGTDSEQLVRSGDAGEPPSRRVVGAISEATGRDPLELPPLAETIDPDALDALFSGGLQSDGSGSPTTDGQVAFRFAGCEVVVHADGRTVVSCPDEPPVG
jgi:hypothetical protein